MPSTEPAELRKARKASGAALLRVESAALIKLRGTVERVVASSRPDSSVAIVATSHRIEDAVAADVLKIRTASRRESRATFGDEMRAASIRPLDIRVTQNNRDSAAASLVGKAYAAAWLSHAVTGSDAAPRDAAREATRSTDYKLAAIAATDVPLAFSDERDRIGTAYAERAKSQLVAVPLKIWWAAFDNTCPRCSALNGTIRPFGVSFPGGGRPGGMHPHCRCYESVTLIGFLKDQEQAA